MKKKLALLIALLLSTQALKPQSFKLEDVLSFPFPSHLTASPAEDRIAWVFNEEGRINIWTATAPDFKPIKLTNYTEDDGQVIHHLRFTPDGSKIIYVRGGNPNRKGEYPNPTSNPHGTKQEIWMISVEGGKPVRIAEGTNPEVSPDGTTLLFTLKGQIYKVSLKPPFKPELLFKARGRNGSQRWSPDGKYVAFVSNRGDHSFIGIYDIENDKIKWIAPSVDRDMLPTWSPDGKKIAFIRMPGFRKHEVWNITAGYPFSIYVADVATGTAKKIWSSPGNDGGFAQWYPAHPLRWTKTDRILFYSEHSGWMHIYSISPDGNNLVDLTPGECEAEHSEVSKDGKYLYFSTNKNDIDRRHIWKVKTTGGKPVQLTKNGIETYPVPLASGKFVALLSATAKRPPAVSLISANGGKIKIIAPEKLPERFPLDKLVVPKQVILTASDGMKIHAQLFLPKDAKPGDKRPAVIFLHGGPIRQMLLGWHYSHYYSRAYAFNQYLVSKGYVVLSVNFRSGIGYGRAFRQAPNQGPRGASEYKDVLAGALYLRTRPEVDPEKIGLWGGSYGGYLTALGLARDSDLFKAGVDLHGVHDWSFRATDFSPGGGWGLRKEDLELAYKSSPVANIDFWSSPVLLIHGDDDRNVLFSQTVDLVQRLREKGVHVETLIFPDEVHSFLLHRNWLRAYKKAAEFFDRFLR